jgi:tryptophan halogenase
MDNKIDIHHAYTTLAYHIDCGKLVKRLQEICQRDMNIIKSEVVDVIRDDEGYITELKLANGQTHKGDFFIDCTGFGSILKKPDRVELLGEGRLFTNTAVAGHVEYKDIEKERTPYVNCPAVDHGWIWKIPTQSRIGSGMVFNRDVTDIDTAKQYFSDHWEGRIKPEDMKVIDWNPYYSKNFWENNVVSIGLSGGFIEPLESTGLASMTTGVQELAKMIPQQWYDDKRISTYNDYMMDWYNDAVDFINSHYADTKWDTPFWNFVKETHVKSDKHLYYERWLKDPNKKFYSNVDSTTLFHSPNWQLWLIQMGYPVNKDLNYINPRELDHIMQNFLVAEQMRMLSSISHVDAIESTNIGTDWYQRYASRGDGGQLV